MLVGDEVVQQSKKLVYFSSSVSAPFSIKDTDLIVIVMHPMEIMM